MCTGITQFRKCLLLFRPKTLQYHPCYKALKNQETQNNKFMLYVVKFGFTEENKSFMFENKVIWNL